MRDEEMDKLLAAVERQLGTAWSDTIDWLRDHNQLDDVAARLRNGEVLAAIEGVEDAAKRFATEINDAFLVSGQKEAAWLDGLVDNKLISFDGTNARAVAWADANKAELVRELAAEQREVIRGVVTDGVRAGHNPRVIARNLRDSIGLTHTQERHVASYRRALETGDLHNALGRELRDARSDKALRRALENGTAIDPKRINKMVERYRKNYVAYRAEVIARTEALRAVHQGTEELFQQTIDASQIEPQTLVRRWNSMRDGKTRSSHRAMHGQERGLGEKFKTGAGYAIAYPGDPNAPISEIVQCRCVLSTRYIPIPEGFATNGMPLRRGIPQRDDIDPGKLYAVSARSLKDRLIALPGGGDDAVRMQSIRDAWANGTKLQPVQLSMLPGGELFVNDGRHRLLVAIEDGRDVLLQLDTSAAGTAFGTVPLVKWLWSPRRAA